MACVTLKELPPPPPGRVGWPWTEETPAAPSVMPGRASWQKISIVTPSYNQGQFLEETIRSVLLQGYPELEYIIIDGGSQDQSVEIISKYAPWLKCWVSEPDEGQCHAINKGLACASGELFNFINSDDLLTPGVLQLVASSFGDSDAVAGWCQNFTQEGNAELGRNRGLSAGALIAYRDVEYHQPAIWLRTRQVEQCGGLCKKFHYHFDLDLFVRYLALFPKVTYCPRVLARFRLHETSKTVSQTHQFNLERPQVLRRLLKAPEFHMLHAECDQYLREREWWSELDNLNQNHQGLQRAVKILQSSCVDPGIRWSRLMLGAVRKALQEPVRKAVR
jgi:Glycosyl transferase family 2